VPEKEKAVCDLMRSDIKDASFVKDGVRIALQGLVPGYSLPKHFRFNLIDTGSGFVVDSDLNYQAINAIYHQSVSPSHSTINDAYLLAHLLEARTDTFFAAYYMAEPVTTPLTSRIIRLKHFDFLQRRDANESEIEQFRDVIVPDFPSIREVINAGERSFSEFLALLDQADKFKSWLQTANPDMGLVQSYHHAATGHTWADKIPTKATRFCVAAGLGLAIEAFVPSGIGAAAALSVHGLDALYLDRLIKGWRPNQFIEGPYTEFVTGKSLR
jgi:hypothetical protein